jgi:hypothetical protein
MTKTKTDMTLAELERCLEARGVRHVSIHADHGMWHLRVARIATHTKDYFGSSSKLTDAAAQIIRAMPKRCYKCGAVIKEALLHDEDMERCAACGDPG